MSKAYNSEQRMARYESNIEHYREVQRKYDATHKKPKEHGRKWVENNRQKVNAKHMVYKRVKKGEIIKPLFCEGCGSNKRLDGHHQDYSRPLMVVWLCRPCHMFVHKVYKI